MATQTLIIEGGLAGTVYTLTSSESSLTFKINESNVTEVTAINDSDAFNPATLILSVGDFVSSTNLDITASSIYEDANSTGISIEPSRVHSIVVEDTDNNLLNQASVTLNTTNLSTFNLEQDYLTNASGEVLVTLPDDDNDYSVEASYSGLSSASAQLLSTVLEQTITLDNVANPVLLTGNISAASPLSFNPTAPIVTLILQDDSEVNIPVSLISNSSVSFNYTHDLNNGELKTLVVSHVDGVDLSINLLTRSNTFEFDILLNAQSSTTVVIATSESGAGGMEWLILLIISLIINPSFFAKKELYKRYK